MKKEETLARPKTIKYKTGEVVLKNLTTEDRDRVEAFLTHEEPSVIIFDEEKQTHILKALEEQKPGTIVAVESKLTETALGFCRVDGQGYEVELSYDPKTKEAKVVDMKLAHKNENIARNQFLATFSKKFL